MNPWLAGNMVLARQFSPGDIWNEIPSFDTLPGKAEMERRYFENFMEMCRKIADVG
jgi:hypothetical protein